MEIGILEAIGWVALGFAVTFAGLEAAWRMDKRSRPALEAKIR
jgi:hypothetical protein